MQRGNTGLTGGISQPTDGIHTTTKHVYDPYAKHTPTYIPYLIGGAFILLVVGVLFFVRRKRA